MNDFAKDIRDRWKAAEDSDKDNREEALLDLKFEAGEHWDPRIQDYREQMGQAMYGFPLPCITVHTIPQFINQVVGDRQANATSIKVLPREDGDKDVAEIRSELIRSIELQSKADRVYIRSYRQAVGCGVGNLRVDLDWAYEDAFEKDLFIRSIPNPLAVLWDPMASDPTGRDATYCFVADKITKEEYKRRFPKAKEGSLTAVGLEAEGWVDGETVRIAEYHEIFEKERTFALMNDGRTLDITDKDESEYREMLFLSQDGKPRMRTAGCKYARMTLTNGVDALDDPFEIKLHRLPIVRVTGQEMWVGDKRHWFGLTRFMRDPARLKDYFRSVRAELLMLAPRANWIASADAIEGRADDWKNTLVYNEGKQAPTPASQDKLAALLTEEQFCSQDMKEVTGIHEAELGMRSNETSGIAIARRQQQGDIATIGYSHHMDSAQQETGEILNALIPLVYDTARTIRTVGVDDAVKIQKINYPGDPESVDIGIGRYDVAVSTGPGYATKRQESASQLVDLANRNGKLVDAAGDLIIDQLDLINGDKIAERVKRTIDPAILGDDANDDKSPEEQQADQERVQEAEGFKRDMAMLEHRKATAEAVKAEAEARKASKEAGDAEAGINKQTVDAKNAETQRLKAITAKDFPLPPSAVALLTPIVTQAIVEALQSPDVLPFELHAEIAEEAYDAATQPTPQEIAANMPPENPEEQAA